MISFGHLSQILHQLTAQVEVTMSQKTEQWWEKKLGIETAEHIDRFFEEACNPYEPTDYCILEKLVKSGYITSGSHFLDYGCGLGRSLFFMVSVLHGLADRLPRDGGRI